MFIWINNKYIPVFLNMFYYFARIVSILHESVSEETLLSYLFPHSFEHIWKLMTRNVTV
jgi:hypothetical protein